MRVFPLSPVCEKNVGEVTLNSSTKGSPTTRPRSSKNLKSVAKEQEVEYQNQPPQANKSEYGVNEEQMESMQI